MRGLLAAGALVLFLAAAARADIYINELTVRPAGASETVELYNSGPGDVDVGGKVLRGNKGSYTIPSPSPIPQGGYLALSVGDIQDERGGVTSLIDLVRHGSGLRSTGLDSVFYGQEGSAPLPPQGTSLSRAPDASVGIVPPPDPDLDGLVWTLDFSPTFGSVNDAPAPQVGQPFLINEFDPLPEGGGDPIEFYNPGGVPMTAGGWLLVNGDAAMPLNGVLPPGGFLVVTTIPGFDLDNVGLLYLFRPDGVRVDQIGFHDAPPLGEGDCYARCPDGSPPYLGYAYLSSGGGTSFFPAACTLGSSNGGDCSTGGVPGREVQPTGWGRLKHRYR